ncbi:YgfZ/GcvT domain-containing protein, partial [Comamonas kerstersii]
MTETLQGIAPISHLGIIRVQGDDAASFLHGQLTNDFVLLDQQHARLAAFCSAKGRMQASFIGFKRAPDDILLICSQDLLTRTLKRLSMFVLRAKAKLTDASADFQLFGLIGNAVPATEAPWTLHTQADGSHLVHLYPAAGQPRALLVAPVGTPAPQGTVLTPEQWLWTEVASGIAMVSEPVF